MIDLPIMKIDNNLSANRNGSETEDQYEYTFAMEAQRIGKLGLLFGSPQNAALYIASIVLVLVVLMLGAAMLLDNSIRLDLASSIAGIGLASLGYIGGLLSK